VSSHTRDLALIRHKKREEFKNTVKTLDYKRNESDDREKPEKESVSKRIEVTTFGTESKREGKSSQIKE
jgi:hypothetical protein